MTKKHQFRPGLNDWLEDRITPSTIGMAAVVKTAGPPIVRQATVNDVGRSIDTAFNRFNKDYTKELATLNHTHNTAKFQAQVAQSVSHLRSSLAAQAARFPKGSDILNAELQHRVDTLVADLGTNKGISAADQVKSDDFGAHQDLNSFVHDQITKGDFTVR
jgi:hypothetical protein